MRSAIEEAIQHARNEFPRESCGFIVKDGDGDTYLPAENVSTGNDHFRIHRDEYVRVSDAHEVVGVVHSHPNEPAKPSEADMVGVERSGIPWLIISYNPGVGGDPEHVETKWVQPTGFRLPLIRRTFAHGVVDCYTLVKDYYEWEQGIAIPDFDREDDWWTKGQNLYLDNFEKAGFVEVPMEDVRNGDVLLMHIGTPAEVPCHAGIYLEGGIVLHHLPKRLSSRDVYGGYYRRHTVKVLRHKSLC